MKKGLSVLLCFIMLLSVPVTAQAAAQSAADSEKTSEVQAEPEKTPEASAVPAAPAETEPVKPKRVKNVKPYRVAETSLKLKWKKVENATSYQVYCSTKKVGGYVKVKTVTNLDKFKNAKKMKVKIKKLQSGTAYYFKIRALNGKKKGKCSKPVTATTKVAVPETPKYTFIRQNDPLNKGIPYPYKDNGKTIGSSGCGVCSSIMVIRNTTKYAIGLEDYTYQCLATECRQAYGSDMLAFAELNNKYYSMTYTVTKSNKKLKAHLAKGYMATAHVGTKLLFTDTGGHFVAVAGMIKGATPQQDRAIVLDPSFSVKKYSKKERVDAGITYTKDGYVITSFETLKADGKGEYYVLFTPAANVLKTPESADASIPKPAVPGELKVKKKILKQIEKKKKAAKKK